MIVPSFAMNRLAICGDRKLGRIGDLMMLKFRKAVKCIII